MKYSYPPEPVSLIGNHVELHPLNMEHADALAKAVLDGELWKLWFTMIPSPQEMKAWIAKALAEKRKTFSTLRSSPETKRKNRGKHALHEHRIVFPTSGDRFHLVCEGSSKNVGKHGMQTSSLGARVRKLGLYRRRIQNASTQ